MTPRILCEEFLNDGTGFLPTDYKVYCFNGRPGYVLCCFDRVPNGKASLAVADPDWNPVLFYRDEPPGGRPMPRPQALQEILDASEKLSRPFPFVRVDFYSIGGRAVLGELTFTPDACIDPTYTDEIQQEMGSRLQLPPRAAHDIRPGNLRFCKWSSDRGRRRLVVVLDDTVISGRVTRIQRVHPGCCSGRLPAPLLLVPPSVGVRRPSSWAPRERYPIEGWRR